MTFFAFLIAFLSLQLAVSQETTNYNDLPLPLAQAQLVTLEANEIVRLVLNATLDPDHEFWIFEAHAQETSDGLELSNVAPYPELSTSNATDADIAGDYNVTSHPGAVVFRQHDDQAPFAFLSNKDDFNTTVVLYVRGYTKFHPVPGKNRPELNVTWNVNEINLTFELAGPANDTQGNQTSPVYTYDVYQHYLTERNLDEDKFLDQISSTMMRLDDIRYNGHLVSDDFVLRNATQTGGSRVVFSAYPGTAVLFTVVVTTVYTDANDTDHALSSVYITSATYSCNLDPALPYNCEIMSFTIIKVISGLSVFVGVFLAFFGHRQYLLGQFVFGTYAAGIVAFTAIAVVNDGILVSYNEHMGLTLAIGLIGGILWALVWYALGIPLLSTMLSTAMTGFLLGSIFVYLPPLNTVGLASTSLYWMTVSAFALGALLAVLPFTKTASILSCSILGTFIFIVPVAHYIGSSLGYIVFNVIRRAYVQDFDKAVLYFPFQSNDIALVCGWLGLAVLAYVVQYFREKNRAPFPPNPYQLRRWRREANLDDDVVVQNAVNNVADETQPLLDNSSSGAASGSTSRRPMSPTSRSPPRYRPVVGYISTRDHQNRAAAGGEGYGALLASSPVIRGLESPTLYQSQPAGVVEQAPPASPGIRFWPLRQNEQVQQHMASSVEERDLFRPPPGHPSQK